MKSRSLQRTLQVSAIVSLTLAVWLMAASSFGMTAVEEKLGGWSVHQCRADGKVCLFVDGDSADGSALGQIYYGKNVRAKLVETGTGKVTKVIKSERGYIDLSNNEFVMIDGKGPGRTERVFNLKTLHEKLFSMR